MIIGGRLRDCETCETLKKRGVILDLVYSSEIRRYEKKLKEYIGLKDKKVSDYFYKSEILKNNIPILVNNVSHTEREFLNRGLPIDTLSRDTLSEMFGFCAMLESYRLQDSYKHRIQRLRSKILEIICECSNNFFITFTFTNKILESTNSETRRKYVQRWLKDNCSNFVANIDFGEKNHREHYHALVSCNRVDSSSWFNNYGAMNFEKVSITTDTDKKLAKYINKFLYHAIKETTKRQHILYSRKKITSHN